MDEYAVGPELWGLKKDPPPGPLRVPVLLPLCPLVPFVLTGLGH